MNWNSSSIFILFALLMLGSSCESEFDRLVRKELQSGVQNNALIFGIEMGQDKQYFFERCAELNTQKLVTQGKGRYAEYILKPKDTTNAAAYIEMQFFGMFKGGKISGMNMKFSYRGWALWNERYQPEILIQQLKDTLSDWYPGNAFIPLEMENSETPAFVKVDGNRLMRMFVINQYQVAVRIEDLNQRN